MVKSLLSILAMVLCFQSIGLSNKTDISLYGFQESEQDVKNKYLKIDSFANFMDSLFANKEYHKIIDIYCDTTNFQFRSIKTGNAIAAYFMMGDTLRSDSIIMNIINCCNKEGRANASEAYWNLQFDNSIGWVYFLNFPYNKNKIDALLRDILKLEQLKMPEVAEKIFLMYINDQYSRKQADIFYWNMSGTRRVPLFFELDSIGLQKMAKQTNDDVFKLLHESKRIFSKEEVGENLAIALLFLLIHESDLERRKFYLELIKEAEKKAICTKSNIVNFILRTEYMQIADGKQGLEEYKKGLEARRVELIKEYDVQDYIFNSW